VIDPREYNNMLLTSAQCTSDFSVGTKVLLPSPLTDAQRARIAPYYQGFLASHEANNLRICSAFQYMLQGALTSIDVSTDRSLEMIERNSAVELGFKLQPKAAQADLHCLASDEPFERRIELACKIVRYGLTITLPDEIRQHQYLRRVLRFQVWTDEFQRLQEFRCLVS
jgi:hypothetical protein